MNCGSSFCATRYPTPLNMAEKLMTQMLRDVKRPFHGMFCTVSTCVGPRMRVSF